ncbi:MAG: glycosyltransferase [Candidatus Omnitrophica bacterium]|nr:glycosyltransferase [Candidatus Omnitrophota bacterium]
MAKTLIIYASFGEGHKQAALALRKYCNAPCKDLLNFSPPFFKRIYSYSYLFITNYFPFIWEYFYSKAQRSVFALFIERIHQIVFWTFFIYLEIYKPETIITTHFFPSFMVSLVKKKLGVKVISVVTDLRAYPLWVNKYVDTYVVAHDLTKRDLIELGVDQDKILSGYVSLREGFLTRPSDQDIRKKLKVGSKPCLLFMSSLRGKFPYVKDMISSFGNEYTILIIYGKNKRLKSYLDEKNFSYVRYFPFYQDIWELMSISSIIVTKPGGLTVFEGLYLKKPFIFTHYIPPQEEENMKLLIKYGVGKYVRDGEEFIEAVNGFSKQADQISNNYPLEIQDIRKVLTEYIN